MHVGEPKRQDPFLRRLEHIELRGDTRTGRPPVDYRGSTWPYGLQPGKPDRRSPKKVNPALVAKIGYILIFIILIGLAGHYGGW